MHSVPSSDVILIPEQSATPATVQVRRHYLKGGTKIHTVLHGKKHSNSVLNTSLRKGQNSVKRN